MKDLIERQTAINALGERPMVWMDSDYEIAQRNQYDLDRLAIETVPSAQPEPCEDALGVNLHVVKISKHCSDFSDLDNVKECEDAVSRLAVRHALCKAVHKNEKIPCENQTASCLWSKTRVCDYVREIDRLPSVTPKEQRWIPCSERLPEEDTEVLISYRYKEGEGDTDHVNIDITSYGTICFGGREIHTLKEWRQPFDYFHANYEVIAWMPLPEPYREEGDE